MAKGAGWSKSSIDIAIGGIDKLKKDLAKMDAQAQKAVNRTVSDVKSRAPAWVSASVTEVYTIKKAEVKAALTGTKKGVGSIKIGGVSLDNVQLIYSGRALTPIHFKMKPTKPPTKRAPEGRRIPGQLVKSDKRVGDVAIVNPIAPYQITVETFKGKITKLDAGAFLAPNKGGGFIPFQRTGDSRTPIESIKRLSIPQMIENDEVREKIQKRLSEGIASRLEHNVDRLAK